MERRALLGGVAAGTTVALAGCVGDLLGSTVEEERSLSFDAPADGEVSVVTRNGDVSVETHDRGDVAVDAVVSAPSEERFDDVSVTGAVRDGDLAIGLAVEGNPGSVGVDLDVQVPVGTGLAGVDTDNGDVTVRDVAGVGEARSENGDVRVRRSGPVGGASTDNGEVVADLPAPFPGDVTVASENGDVTANVSLEASVSVTATTENGEVDVAEELQLADANVTESRVTGRLRDGEHALTVKTVNGDVTLGPA